MKKYLDTTQKKVIVGLTVLLLAFGTFLAVKALNKPPKDMYELQVKYLGGKPDVLKFEMPHTGRGFEITVLKNGEVFKTFDMNESSGQYNLPDLKVEAYDYSKVSYLLTQEQFETPHEFKKGSGLNWQAIADWHLANMKDTKPFEIKAQYLSDDGEVLAEAVINYIVVDEEVATFDLAVSNRIVISKGEENIEEKFQEHMKKVGSRNDLEYKDTFEGSVDVNVAGSYPVIVNRTTTRNGLVSKTEFVFIVEEKVAVVEQPSTNTSKPTNNNNSTSNSSGSQSNNSSTKPNTGGGTSSGSKPTTPSSPNTNGSGSNNSNNSGNSGNNGGGTTTPPQPSRPAPEAPSGMVFYKDYGNVDGCIAVMYSVGEQHVREWNSNFCDDYGYMYYTPNN